MAAMSRIPLVVAALILCLGAVASAQTPVMHDGNPALHFHSTFYYEGNVGYYVDRIFEGEPKFKFLAKKNDSCFGLMFVSKSSIFYSGGQGCENARFDYRRDQLTGVQPSTSGFTLFLPSGKASFTLDWRSDSDSGPDEQAAAARFVALIFQDYDAAQQEFVRDIAPLRASLKPPVIAIFEPGDVQEGKVLRVSGDAVRLRGTVTSQSGIVAMAANGQPAQLKQLSSQVSEFDIRLSLPNPGVTPVVVTATAGDTSEAEIAFAVNRSSIEILEPASKSESPAETLKVRGIARGFGEIQRVEIAGLPAALTRRDDGVEFEFAKVPLTLGDNVLDGAVVTADSARVPFQVLAKRLPPPGPPPLTMKEVTEALGSMPKPRVMELVKKYGVDFDLNDANEQQLREAGATPEVLLVIARAKK
jgi:hypothetical protein